MKTAEVIIEAALGYEVEWTDEDIARLDLAIEKIRFRRREREGTLIAHDYLPFDQKYGKVCRECGAEEGSTRGYQDCPGE